MSESSPLAPGALAWLTDVLDQIEREAKDAYAEARDMNAADAARGGRPERQRQADVLIALLEAAPEPDAAREKERSR